MNDDDRRQPHDCETNEETEDEAEAAIDGAQERRRQHPADAVTKSLKENRQRHPSESRPEERNQRGVRGFGPGGEQKRRQARCEQRPYHEPNQRKGPADEAGSRPLPCHESDEREQDPVEHSHRRVTATEDRRAGQTTFTPHRDLRCL